MLPSFFLSSSSFYACSPLGFRELTRRASEIEDCTREWTFPDGEFDYIHIRYVVGSIADWPALFKSAYKCLKPGGWIESYEGSPNIRCDDAVIPPTSAMGQWGPLFVNGSQITGRSCTVIEENTQKDALQEAGFVDLQEKNIKVRVAHPLSTTTSLR